MEDANLQNTKNLQVQGAYHGTAFVAAAVLWGAADSWSIASDLAVADFFLLLSSVVFGIALSHIAHEWNHFLGAVRTGSKYTVKDKPAFLFFDFDYVNNTREQFLAMSTGGLLGNSILVLLVFILIPLDSAGRTLLLATTVAMTVYVAVVEYAVIQRTRAGEEPLEVLTDHFGEGPTLFRRAKNKATVSGLGLWALLLLVF